MGLGDRFKTQEIMDLEILMFKIMKSGFYCTNQEQISSRKLLNLLFKHISRINDPKIVIIIPIFFPMIFPMIFL